MNLSGRSAIITGGSVGLGYGVARRFLADGANVAICSRNAEELKEAQKRLAVDACPGRQVIALECDVSSTEQVDGLVGAALEHFGTVEILVNNAGVLGPLGRFDEVDIDQWKQTVAVNLLGAVITTRAVLPHFRERRYGKILNVSGGGADLCRGHF